MTAPLPYIKMNGLGNDFVVLDGRAQKIALTRQEVIAIADRATGIGCDQVIIMEPDSVAGVDVFMRIYNAEGGEVDACGNATRCIAGLVATETGLDAMTIRTNAGLILTKIAGDQVTADMGVPRFEWDQIRRCSTHRPWSMSAIRTQSSGSRIWRRTISPGSDPCLKITRSFLNAPISPLPRCSPPTASGCGSGSAARD